MSVNYSLPPGPLLFTGKARIFYVTLQFKTSSSLKSELVTSLDSLSKNLSSDDPCSEISLLHTFTSDFAQEIRGVPDHPNHSSCSTKVPQKKQSMTGLAEVSSKGQGIWVVLRFLAHWGGSGMEA